VDILDTGKVDDDGDDDDEFPSIEKLLRTTLQREGFAAGDQRPNNTASVGVVDTGAEKRGGSFDNYGSAPIDNFSGSPGKRVRFPLFRETIRSC
jgi:hypothetical protein